MFAPLCIEIAPPEFTALFEENEESWIVIGPLSPSALFVDPTFLMSIEPPLFAEF
jgi:hypothetical protein